MSSENNKGRESNQEPARENVVERLWKFIRHSKTDEPILTEVLVTKPSVTEQGGGSQKKTYNPDDIVDSTLYSMEKWKGKVGDGDKRAEGIRRYLASRGWKD